MSNDGASPQGDGKLDPELARIILEFFKEIHEANRVQRELGLEFARELFSSRRSAEQVSIPAGATFHANSGST